jgi:hypothetical protein
MCRSRGERPAAVLRQSAARFTTALKRWAAVSLDRGATHAVLWIMAALIASGCGRSASSRSLDQEAREYVRLAFALGERDPDSFDFYAGPEDLVSDIRRDPPSLSTIGRDASALAATLAEQHLDAADAARVRVLSADLAAIVGRVELLRGKRFAYDTESRLFFGVTAGPIDERSLADNRSKIAERVGGRGGLLGRYVAFASRVTVPATRLPDVMRAALDECRRRTVARIALPADERVTIEFVRDKPWSAFSRYGGDAHSTIQINTDFSFTVDQALQLACHEGYPGHHTRNTLAMPRRQATGVAPERSIQLMFTPEALESEASATLAADVAFSPEARLRVEQEQLFPLAGLPADDAALDIEVERHAGELQIVQADVARRYLDGQLEFARAVVELQERALVPHAEPLVKYINEYRSYVTTYTVGPPIIAARLARCAGARPTDDARWRCYQAETLVAP